MRRPVLLGGLAAMVLSATPASAQRVIRQAFEPAVTPFIGATGFDIRVKSLDAPVNDFGYDNGFALGVQLDRPWTRRTAFMSTVALSPLSHVVQEFPGGAIDRLRVVVLGLDAGVAARFKPSAPIFGYAGGGAVIGTRPPSFDLDGVHVEPRITLGVGMDAGRRARTGVRIAYYGHYVFARLPDNDYRTVGTPIDWTFVLGLRRTLGARAGGDGR